MSHITVGRTNILGPDPTLLREAAEIVAQQHIAEMQQQRVSQQGQLWGLQPYFLDYNHHRHPTELAIFVPGLARGMALVIDLHTQELQFVGDDFGVEDLYSRVQQEIQQTYVALAFKTAMEELGFTVEAQLDEQQNYVLTAMGESYA